MVCLGLKPGAVIWSYGGRPRPIGFTALFNDQ